MQIVADTNMDVRGAARVMDVSLSCFRNSGFVHQAGSREGFL